MQPHPSVSPQDSQRPIRGGRLRDTLLCATALLFTAVVVLAGWHIVGPRNPIYAGLVTTVTFAVGPALGDPVECRLPRRWFAVPVWENRLHHYLGVNQFAWILQRSGWNRTVADPMRRFDGTRTGLPSLEQSLRGNCAAHGIGFGVHMMTATALWSAGYFWPGWWVLLPGVLIHLYPVLLQRSTILRVQRLKGRINHTPPS